MNHVRFSSMWISSYYQGSTMTFKIGDVRTRWRIGTRLEDDKHTRDVPSMPPPRDSTAVYNCTRIDGEGGPPEVAVLKINMQ